jgi:DNA-binding CsgD family transcriptional regulator
MREIQETSRLSSREKAIIRLVAQAKCRKTIAKELKVSIHTVDTHLRHIHLKTNTHSLPELVVWEMTRLSKQSLVTY